MCIVLTNSFWHVINATDSLTHSFEIQSNEYVMGIELLLFIFHEQFSTFFIFFFKYYPYLLYIYDFRFIRAIYQRIWNQSPLAIRFCMCVWYNNTKHFFFAQYQGMNECIADSNRTNDTEKLDHTRSIKTQFYFAYLNSFIEKKHTHRYQENRKTLILKRKKSAEKGRREMHSFFAYTTTINAIKFKWCSCWISEFISFASLSSSLQLLFIYTSILIKIRIYYKRNWMNLQPTKIWVHCFFFTSI